MVTSTLYVGCVVGACLGGSVCDYYGRRSTVFIVSGIFVAGSLLIALADFVTQLYIGRFIVGVGVAISAIVDVSYLTEISPDEYRGAVVSANEVMITLGFLLAYVVSYIFASHVDGWRYMLGFPAVLATIWSTLMYGMPESPRWLLVKHREDEALVVYETISNSVDEAHLRSHNAKETVEAIHRAHQFSWMQILIQWRASLVISILLMIFQNLSGNAGILAYAPEFFRYAGFENQASSVATITLGVVKVLSTVAALCLVDRVGRRYMLLIGIAGMAFSLVILSIIFSTVVVDGIHITPLSQSSSLIVIITVSCFVACYGLGYGTCTWLVATELFVDEVRGRMMGMQLDSCLLSTILTRDALCL